MNDDILISELEKHIDLKIDFSYELSGNNAYENYKYNVLKRLINAFDFYSNHKKAYGDYLSSLRNFLVTWNCGLKINNLPIDHLNEFDLYIESGSVFARISNFKHIHDDFTMLAFQQSDHTNHAIKETSSNLYTDYYIKNLTGFNTFRSESQKLAVYGALKVPNGYTMLISLPTGGGKSLITQTVAYQKPGLTIVIVPTVSLSIDQERVAKKRIRTENVEQEIFSYSSGVDMQPILKSIKEKKARLLFISPETLVMNPQFQAAINEANQSKYLKNIVIDEAHIVTDWGSLFRVDYQCMESWRNNLMVVNPDIRTFLLSATFEDRCVSILKNLFSKDKKWIELRCDSLRTEPRFGFISNKTITEKNQKIVDLIRKLPHPLIVYVSRPAEADILKDILKGNGFYNVNTFTGTTSNTKRRKLIDDWVDNKYEIMIATSAFGVGVDKSDVRTVIHAYVPQNPNAYYQELGRGGRDNLPCLSIMCIMNKIDLSSAFQRINKKVMTTAKICKRWVSMFNNTRSIRKDNHYIIDTSIKPNYRMEDNDDEELEFVYSDSDVNWNVYVLLFLRRNNLIHIDEVVYDKGAYKFQVSEINDILLIDNDEDENLNQFIEKYRNDEYQFYLSGYQTLQNSIQNADKECWSEMFYETYDCIDEYCAGCGNHSEIISSSSEKFPLKRTINLELTCDNPFENLFNSNKDIILQLVKGTDKKEIISKLVNKGIKLVVTEDSILDLTDSNRSRPESVMTISRTDLISLLDKGRSYYLSDVMLIVYPENPDEKKKYINTYLKKRRTLKNVRIIHLLSEDVYISTYDKMYTDMIDGSLYHVSDTSEL